MNMHTDIRILALTLTVLAAVGCASKQDNKETTAPAAAPAIPAESVSKITVAKAQTMEVPQNEVYTSTVQAFAVNNIAPQTGGRIKSIKADIGSFVGKGQLLAVMDESQIDQTYLKLVNDSTELGRLKSLYEEGGVSKSDLDAVEMAYKVSRKSYNTLLENTYLKAPITGVVTARNYDVGDLYAGQPIFVVQQITPVKILVGISEADYSKVKKGDVVGITADALPGKEFSGKVNKLYPTIDPATRTFTTEVLVQNSDRTLRPGMYAKVTVEFGSNTSVVVPNNAVVKQQGSGQRCVFILREDGTVRSSVVKLGRLAGDFYEILEGVSEGDIVAVRGSASLKDGDKVEVIE